MKVLAIHSFLTHAGKALQAQPAIGGTAVKKTGAEKLRKMLVEIFDKADAECSIEIAFVHNTSGRQQNDQRDRILTYVHKPTLKAGRALAASLQGVTTNKSGLGLFFLILGEHSEDGKKLVLSRFPADSGILAEQTKQGLSVEFLERVFMKNAGSYKAALYRGTVDEDFWIGSVVDKQINNSSTSVSNYWIKDFLASDYRTTSAAGTRRLATALLEATRHTKDLDAKAELAAAARLANALDGKAMSARGFCDRFGLSDTARSILRNQLPTHLAEEKFEFSAEEFRKHVGFRSVELDSGALLSAPFDTFDKTFELQEASEGKIRYVAEGRVTDERLRRSR